LCITLVIIQLRVKLCHSEALKSLETEFSAGVHSTVRQLLVEWTLSLVYSN
jgi:hypothetical protein